MSASTTAATNPAGITVGAAPDATEQRDKEGGDCIPSQHTQLSAPVTDYVRALRGFAQNTRECSADDVGNAVSHGVDRGVDAGPQLELDRRLVQQHPNPVHGVGTCVTSSG